MISDSINQPIETAFCTIESMNYTQGGIVPMNATKRTDGNGEARFEINLKVPNRLNINHPLYQSQSIFLQENESIYIVRLKHKYNLKQKP